MFIFWRILIFSTALFFIGGLFENSFAQAGVWTQKANYPGMGLGNGVGFSIGNKGYIGMGGDTSANACNDFWEWDQSSNSWMQKADLPGPPRFEAVGFSIGNKGYIGTGWDGTNIFQDFWEFDPAINTWTQKADYPGGPRYQTTGFSINSKGYISSGRDANNVYCDFYEFDTSINMWIQKANYPSFTFEAAGFSIGSKGYMGSGYYYQQSFYEYDPSSDVWTMRGWLGLGIVSAVAFSINGKGYIGTGQSQTIPSLNTFSVWDPATNVWTPHSWIPNGGRQNAVGFSIGNKGYCGTAGHFPNSRDFWEFDPSVVNVGQINPGTLLRLFPNPNNGLFYISGVSEKAEVIVYNSSGEIIYSAVIESGNVKLDLRDKPKGVYITCVMRDGSKEVKKVIIH